LQLANCMHGYAVCTRAFWRRRAHGVGVGTLIGSANVPTSMYRTTIRNV